MLKGLFGFLRSLKLAVILLLGLAASLAVATFIESGYDTHTAQYWVYRSWWFEGLLALLGVNILSVALSRWPWKPKHIPFLLAHLGILILLTGSFITQKFGLDGSMTITEGQVSNLVDLGNSGLVLIDGDSVRRVAVPWIPPGTEFKPVDVRRYGVPYDLRIDRYFTHADPNYNFIEDTTPPPPPGHKHDAMADSLSSEGKPAIQVTVKGGVMGIVQSFWLWAGDPQWSSVQAGPALLTLGAGKVPKGSPSLMVIPTGKGIRYVATSSEGRKVGGYLQSSKINGKVVDPGWRGGVKLIFGRFVPRALPQTTYSDSRIQYGQQAPSSAVHLVTGKGGPGSSLWLGLGERAVLEVHGHEVEVGYMPDRAVLPFEVRLDHFRIDHYEGTRDPSEYSSQVTVLDAKGSRQKVISMNEPLTDMGVTLYQASYVDAMPRPTTSILSVNRDPGRPWKYLGSLLIVLGSFLLFAMKYRQKKRSAA